MPKEPNRQLIQAIMKDNVDAVEKAIKQRISVQMSDRYAPLHLAVQYSKPEIVDLLLKNGADKDINKQNETTFNLTPLGYALTRKDGNAAKLAAGLLLYGADPALLSPEIKKRHVAFFNRMLSGVGLRLDIPRFIMSEKKRLKVKTLNDEQRASVLNRTYLTLKMVQNILKADIPGLDTTSLQEQCNESLQRINKRIATVYSPQSGFRSEDERVARAKQELLIAEPILQVGLPLKHEELERYADTAAYLGVPNSLELAKAADPKIWDKYTTAPEAEQLICSQALEILHNTRMDEDGSLVPWTDTDDWLFDLDD
jgi:predicted transcriptional regulator